MERALWDYKIKPDLNLKLKCGYYQVVKVNRVRKVTDDFKYYWWIRFAKKI